jgi:hypothetical protein
MGVLELADRRASVGWGLAGALIAIASFATWRSDPLVPPVSIAATIIVLVTVATGAALVGARADALIARARAWVLAPTPATFGIGVAVVACAGSAFFAWYCLDRQVWIIDEMTQRFQGRALLAGRLSLVAEPFPEFFETRQTAVVRGRWFGEFPIGGVAMVGIAEALRAGWLLNAIATGVSSWALYRFLRNAAGEAPARVTALLFATSPFVLFMGASRMDHPRTLAALLLALIALSQWATAANESRRRLGAAGVGLGIGVLAAIRPFDALLVAVPVGLYQLSIAWRDPDRRRSLLWQVAVGAIPVATMLAVNAATTGHAFQFGYDIVNGPAHRPGFHRDPEGAMFTVARGVQQSSRYLARLNTVMLEWPVPAMAIVALTLMLHRRRDALRGGTLLVAIFGAITLGYTAYWHEGDAFGPRFLFLGVPGLLFCIARFPAALSTRVRGRFAFRFAWLLLGVCAMAAWLPTGGSRVSGVWARAAAYRSVLHPAFPHVERAVRSESLANALVFVREPWDARLGGRLRALGLSPYGADRILLDFDACALTEALAAEDTLAAVNADERLDRIIRTARAAGGAQPIDGAPGAAARLLFVPGRQLTDRCRQALAADDSGTAPYAHFLSYNTIGRDGRIDGSVVFVRDLGRDNERLRDRFPGRRWYRFQSMPGQPMFAPF